ncbi:MAG: HAD hydrolase family protein [Phycisphaerae bacterium]|jgi:Zn-dependent alcohol dehydrogenase
MRFVIDIDGTVLTQQKPGEYHLATPLAGAVEAVNALYDAGHQVVFHTTRNYKYMRQTLESLTAFGFKFHHVCFGKPHGDIFIDDRALRFTDWGRMNEQIAQRMSELAAPSQTGTE